MVVDLEEILNAVDDEKFCNGCVVGHSDTCGGCRYQFDVDKIEAWRSLYDNGEEEV